MIKFLRFRILEVKIIIKLTFCINSRNIGEVKNKVEVKTKIKVKVMNMIEIKDMYEQSFI